MMTLEHKGRASLPEGLSSTHLEILRGRENTLAQIGLDSWLRSSCLKGKRSGRGNLMGSRAQTSLCGNENIYR